MRSYLFFILTTILLQSELLLCAEINTFPAFSELPADYRAKTYTPENPLILHFSFGPEPINQIELRVVNNPRMKSDLFFFHMHNNEVTALKAGEKLVAKNGGTLIYLKHPHGQRDMKVRINNTNYTFDPNRIFTSKALAEKTQPIPNVDDLKELEKFVSWIKRTILKARANRLRPAVIALHNNTDDNIHGERLSILTEKKLLNSDNRMVHQNPNWDIDNFYTATWKSTFDFLMAIIQPNISLRLEKPRNIGYLSNWMIVENIEYILVETEHQDEENNLKMIEVLQAHLK